MRIYVLDGDKDLSALSAHLLIARLSQAQAEEALASLRALNPGVDLARLRNGTVLFVPETRHFRTTRSESVTGGDLEGLKKLVEGALNGAIEHVKRGNESRAAERIETTAALKSSGVKRLMETDAGLKQEIAAAADALKKAQQEDDRATNSLTASTRVALAKLSELGKLFG